jgi:hypothetical protein
MTDETTTFYKKEKDGSYTAIQEYDPQFMDSLPFGIHMVVAEQGSQTRIYNLNPDHISLWASAYLLRNELEKVIEEIYTPVVIPEIETEAQKAAFEAMKQAWVDDTFEIKAPSNREVSDRICELLVFKLIDGEVSMNPTLLALKEKYQAALQLIK